MSAAVSNLFGDSTTASQWRAPSAWNEHGVRDSRAVISWLQANLNYGRAYLQQQRAYTDIDAAIDIISGRTDEKRPAKLSSISINQIKHDFKEIIGVLSNPRPLSDFKVPPGVASDSAYQRTAADLNNLYRAWYNATKVDARIEEVLQYAGITKGYLEPYWDWPDGFHEGEIRLKVHGPRAVIPIQVPADHDIQRAYAAIIINEMPLAETAIRWPEFESQITPDRGNMSTYKPGLVTAVKSFFNRFGPGAQKEDDVTPFPTVDVYHVYIKDDSINTTGQTMAMAPGTAWGYNVPSFGTEIPSGLREPVGDGNYRDVMRPVTRDEAMLYPRRRLIICTNTCVMYDGPSFYWHGMVPLIPFELDKWVWEYLGYSLIRDGAEIQRSTNSLLRAIDDSQNLRLRPPMLVDQNAVAQGEFEKWDPREPGAKLIMNLAMGNDPIKFPVEPGHYDVPQSIPAHVQWLMSKQGELMGTSQARDLAKASQIPSAESIDKLTELTGPLTTKMSRRMETAIELLGEQFKWLAFEFYTTARRIQVLGDDGITEHDLDIDPGNMVPAELPDHPELTGAANRHQRARLYAAKFRFHIVPNSMYQITQFTKKLVLLQLQKLGFPIDWWTIAEAFDLANFGPAPKEANTMMERWIAQQHIQRELAIEAAKETAQAQADVQATMQGGGGAEGRPPSFSAPPRLEQKTDGPASVPRTSIVSSE